MCRLKVIFVLRRKREKKRERERKQPIACGIEMKIRKINKIRINSVIEIEASTVYFQLKTEKAPARCLAACPREPSFVFSAYPEIFISMRRLIHGRLPVWLICSILIVIMHSYIIHITGRRVSCHRLNNVRGLFSPLFSWAVSDT